MCLNRKVAREEGCVQRVNGPFSASSPHWEPGLAVSGYTRNNKARAGTSQNSEKDQSDVSCGFHWSKA